MLNYQLGLDASFEALGEDATFTPNGGSATTVRVIPKRPDQVADFLETRIVAETAVFDVRKSEVAQPAEGDAVTIGGETFYVQGEPKLLDSHRLVWTLDTRPA